MNSTGQPNESASGPPRIVIVEDDASARNLMRGLLVHRLHLPEPECHPTVSTARVSLADSPPDLLLLDIRLKGQTTGLHLLWELRSRLRETAVCIVTLYADPGTIYEAWRQGVAGYLHKPVIPEDFERAVPLLLAGHVWFCPEAQEVILRQIGRPAQSLPGGFGMPQLNDTQRGILVCLASGESSEESIGRLLRHSAATVKNEISRIYNLLAGEKLGHNRQELGNWARRHIECLVARPISLPQSAKDSTEPPLLDTRDLMCRALGHRVAATQASPSVPTGPS